MVYNPAALENGAAPAHIPDLPAAHDPIPVAYAILGQKRAPEDDLRGPARKVRILDGGHVVVFQNGAWQPIGMG